MTAKASSQAVSIPKALTVKELADLLNVSAIEVIKRLMTNGVMASIASAPPKGTSLRFRR